MLCQSATDRFGLVLKPCCGFDAQGAGEGRAGALEPRLDDYRADAREICFMAGGKLVVLSVPVY
jgi:hypothetical protein